MKTAANNVMSDMHFNQFSIFDLYILDCFSLNPVNHIFILNQFLIAPMLEIIFPHCPIRLIIISKFLMTKK